jgi:tetrahydromethanopterin S-methyltransferase subunit G
VVSKETLEMVWHFLTLLFPFLSATILYILQRQNARIDEIERCMEKRLDEIQRAHTSLAEKRQGQHEETIQRLALLEAGYRNIEKQIDQIDHKLDKMMAGR